jgi:hypothetical protein
MSSPVVSPPSGGPRTVPDGAPPATNRAFAPSELGGFLLVAGQLALVLAVVWLFEIAERSHFFAVACLAAGGYLVHAWLPPRLRAPFFCLLSAGGILFVLGWPNGPLVLAAGAILIALCHLPVPFMVRVAVVAGAGLLLAMLSISYPLPFWPVLGSMFMFRIILYLHELRRSPGPPALPITLAYFFPLPNVSFLFFPILDFKTFKETYRPAARWADAQEGVGWVVTGLTHLLAYRAVKYFVLPAPHQLGDVPHAALFLAASYALYLHVSGHFHIITGVLHLFGFQLPRTHDHYFLASSFTDVWRRLNIPWKDFMAKIVFTPAFFGLRGLGTRGAAAVATLAVFAVTWLLHSYQTFWLTGRVELSGYEAALWLGLGVLVAINLQFDLSRPGRRVGPRSPLGAVWWAVRVVGMFALISVFWACWNTPAVLGSVRALPATDPDPAAGAALVLGVLLAVVAVLACARLGWDRLTWSCGRDTLVPPPLGRGKSASPTRQAARHVLVLGALALAAVPQATAPLGPEAVRAVAALRRESVTPAEAAQVVQGYYEDVTAARAPAGAWLAALEGRPRPPRQIVFTDMSRPADDLLGRELIPGWSGEVSGRRVTINHLGMRDRADRTVAKPPDTCRVAVVGSSVVMGYGVGDDEVFTRLLEDRLNARRRPGGPRYEVLNFGTGLSDAIQRRALIDRRVFAFAPDAVYYVAHQDEFQAVRHLAQLAPRGGELPYHCLNEVIRKAGIDPAAPPPPSQILVRLQPHARGLLVGIYRELVEECRRRGVVPVWIYLPMPGVVDVPVRSEVLVGIAREAGFVVVDLSDWAAGQRTADVRAGATDPHASALGHRLVAEQMEALMAGRDDLLPPTARPGQASGGR